VLRTLRRGWTMAKRRSGPARAPDPARVAVLVAAILIALDLLAAATPRVAVQAPLPPTCAERAGLRAGRLLTRPCVVFTPPVQSPARVSS
jgi:hypothetical protein